MKKEDAAIVVSSLKLGLIYFIVLKKNCKNCLPKLQMPQVSRDKGLEVSL